MSKEITFLLEPDCGKLTIEVSGISPDALTALRDDLGSSHNVNCGKPSKSDSDLPTDLNHFSMDARNSIWLYRIYHNSVVDGPGRRSVIQVAGCSIRCPGCYVPETHNRHNGKLVSISSIFDEISSKRHENDGVTIMGGEPFDQANPVAELVSRLKRHNLHVVVYTGNTVEELIKKRDSSIDYILDHIDLLIDGPFESSLAFDAGKYRGSSNQRLLRQK
ncbi:MAG: 4Fe-4S cluster-binding domain-containing protein [Acidobacteriota bacterium]|nr:MAG: 4Fe-4S cluster-binding domain-containing protein [Acidobacteriota bacterium]